MGKGRHVISTVTIKYLNIGRTQDFLDEIFGNNYEISFFYDNMTLLAHRRLTEDELDALQQQTFYRDIELQNEVFVSRSRGKKRFTGSSGGSAASSATQPTENVPSIKPQPGVSHSAKGNTSSWTKGKESYDVSARLGTPDISGIPLFNPNSQATPLMNSMKGLKMGSPVLVEVNRSDMDDQGKRVLSGLYSVQLETGETSNVFNVTVRMSAEQPDQLSAEKVVQKCAIKRLHETISPERFWDEYESLKRLNRLNHPHLVETLSVFRSEMNGNMYFNFMFPLALGNLKRLFRGSYGENLRLHTRAQESLWGQFTGLSSAVAYLHDAIQMAHRDIKPSNILIYEIAAGGNLVLKLTDFGLSVDLTKALTWEQGSLALQSAWLYDSPELRKASPNRATTPSSDKIHIPSARDILANDIWKLGCVFTEMVSFLVCGGSAGVSEFRDYITTTEGKVSSDMFNDTRFDDGENVKTQVLDWFSHLSGKDVRAKLLEPILREMLLKSVQRPTITHVCEALVEVNFPNIVYDDGLRLVRFAPANQVKPATRVETLQLGVEKLAGRLIDWTPFRRPRPVLRPDQFMMMWQWGGHELSMSLSQDELDRYKPTCLPRTTNNTPLLPVANNQAGSSRHGVVNIPLNTMGQPANMGSQPTHGNAPLPGITGHPTMPLPTPGASKDMYWCVEKVFTEPAETHLFPIINTDTLNDDQELYRQVNRAIGSSVGSSRTRWILRRLSWKRCTKVEFVKFVVVWRDRDQVALMQTGLPPTSVREYEHSVPQPYDVHMRAAGEQMVFGLKDPKLAEGETTIINMLPKKVNPPPFVKQMGQEGWGLHVKMGFSQRRFLAWLLICTVLNAIFVIIWLTKINPTDLQNAVVPATIATVALTFGCTVMQMAEERYTSK
ncbi:kinase-like domain-containing protein [Ilyonectria sp. MPI-CAGE-AT-0026]|nr:kinase-like domain-containing protein [Ilyonectria sp. MPI-CAGE-AT-0026]